MIVEAIRLVIGDDDRALPPDLGLPAIALITRAAIASVICRSL